ncbi:hypothetical protein EJB05_15251, partial [Eragrostis curvula]
MEGAGASQSLVNNVGRLLAAEYGQLSGVGGEIAELRDDLSAMNALLRMQSEAKDGSVDPFIQEIMKQVRELAYDSEDRIDLYRLRIKCRRNDGVFARVKHLFQTLSSRRRLAGDVRALRARAIAISERHARYGVNREALGWSPASSAPLLLEAPVSEHALRRVNDPGHHKLVSIGNQVDTLVEQLKARVDGNCLKVFSIVGFGGVGKTTLAKEVFRRLEANFQFTAMVSLSQAFEPARDLTALLKLVLQRFLKANPETEESIVNENRIDDLDPESLADTLKKCLAPYRYLIVIDDVWTIRAWEAIHSVLPESNCDSRIIVTTRMETVAKACSSTTVCGHRIHRMKPLKHEASKKLFLSIAFGFVDYSYPKELEDVMDKILTKCGGLPLALISIASVLSGYRSPGCKDKWKAVCKSIGYQMESSLTLQGMRHIVTLSYNHLPHELKSCMLYFSIFPEDYEISKERLLRRWIAEGLVLEKRGLTPMEVAESYLDELVSRNMVEPVHVSYDGKQESCRVHDMLHEVMVSMSLGSNFVSLLGGQYAGKLYDRIRRLSIQGSAVLKRVADNKNPHDTEQEGPDGTGQDGPDGTGIDLSKILGPRPEISSGPGKDEICVEQYGVDDSVRGPRKRKFKMKLQWKDEICETEQMDADEICETEQMDVQHVRSLSMFHHTGQKLLDHLHQFTLLKVLDLEDCGGLRNHHMRYICRLYLLKFLSLRGTIISVVPRQIEKLEHLQVFDVSATHLKELPETVTNLERLESLQFSKRYEWNTMWMMPRGLKKMKALQKVRFALLGNDIQVAQEVGELKQLQDICVYINSVEESVLREFGVSLSRISTLRRLSIGDLCHDNNSKTLDFLHSLRTPPRYLQYLRIAGGIKKLPTWVGSLTFLVEFDMSRGKLVGDQLFGVLCLLPNLKSVWIQQRCYEDTELVARTTQNFPALINLNVTSDSEKPRILRFEEGSMTKLETLLVNFGNNKKSILGVEHLTNLKEVQLTGKTDNPKLSRALQQLKAESERRSRPNQFKVVVRYDYGLNKIIEKVKGLSAKSTGPGDFQNFGNYFCIGKGLLREADVIKGDKDLFSFGNPVDLVHRARGPGMGGGPPVHGGPGGGRGGGSPESSLVARGRGAGSRGVVAGGAHVKAKPWGEHVVDEVHRRGDEGSPEMARAARCDGERGGAGLSSNESGCACR